MPNVKTPFINGETAVNFDANYQYFWVQNLSDSDMYMSVSPDIVPGADGVMLIPANSGRSTGDMGQCSTLYILGSGKAEITAQYNAVCPYFKYVGKGGEKDERGFKIVDELPETGSSKYIYLVPKSSLLSDNIYNEYLWVEEKAEKWELVGDTKIDLTDYVQKDDIADVVRNPEKRKMVVTAVNNQELSISAWPHDEDVGINMTIPYLTQNGSYSYDKISTRIPEATYDHAGLLLPGDKKKLDKLNSDTDLENENVTGTLPIEKGGTGNTTGAASSLTVAELGSFTGKTIGELKTAIKDWWSASNNNISIARLTGGISWLTDFYNDDYVIPAGVAWQITPIGSAAANSNYGRFMISTYSDVAANGTFILTYNNGNFVKIVKVITSDDMTAALNAVNVKQNAMIDYTGKTVGELKNDIIDWWELAKGSAATYRFSGGNYEWLLNNWSKNESVFPEGRIFTVTPIADYAPNNLYAVFIISTPSSDNSPSMLKVSLWGGNLLNIAPLELSSDDRAKLDSITPEIIEKLANL